METYGRSRQDVVAWPSEPEPRAALEAYLDALSSGRSLENLAGDEYDFRGADLSRLNLVEAYLLGANLNGVRLVGADLTRATLSGADLGGADLSGSELVKAELVEIEADGAVLRGVHAFAADFTKAYLRGADIRDAILNSSRFYGTDLSRADLRGTSLRYGFFGDAELATRLSFARLTGAAVDEVKGWVVGPVDIGDGTAARLVDGAELKDWFAANGAPDVQVLHT